MIDWAEFRSKCGEAYLACDGKYFNRRFETFEIKYDFALSQYYELRYVAPGVLPHTVCS